MVQKNYQLNFNSIKYLNDSLRFKSHLYSRKTISDYDESAVDEFGHVSDNRMHALQLFLENKTKSSESNINLHYQNYDRTYDSGGYKDNYSSEAFVLKGEKEFNSYDFISFGVGAEFRYDRGNFINRGSYSSSTKGNIYNTGTYANLGYKLSNNDVISIYLRDDENKTTHRNQTYKINWVQNFKNSKLITTHSTSIRNPSLYELYGTDNYGINGNTLLKPEKSKSNEILISYDLTKNININSTIFKSNTTNLIQPNSNYTTYENLSSDTNQKGIENEISFTKQDQKLSFSFNFVESKSAYGQAQNRRPKKTLGGNYFKKINQSFLGEINIFLNYKYTGEYIDWDGLKNSKQKEVNIFDVGLTKKINNNSFSFKITNLINEKYEKPATYSQDGRKITFKFLKSY